MPVSDISSVRGIGVAVSVRMSTLVRHPLDALLVLHAEALLLVDDEQAEVLELHVVGEQAVRADHDVDGAVAARRCTTSFCSFADRNRESTSTRTG